MLLSCSTRLGVPCTAGALALSSKFARSVCEEPKPASADSNSSPSYYGSYLGDRFGGGIGKRVGVDESCKHPLADTGVVRVAFFTETHGRLKEWATEANWREATRIHKAAYFTRTQNLVQEDVLQRIRQHYVISSECLDHRNVEAALYRLDDTDTLRKKLSTTIFMRIPMVVHGVFDEKNERCVVDFANKRLGGGWLGYGFVQEEKMFAERPDFGALCARSLLQMHGDPVKEPLASPFSMHPDEAWLLRGAPAFAECQWYGRTPKDAFTRLQLLNPLDDLDTSPTVVAIDAIKADFPKYEREHLEMMLIKAYTGFVAARHDPDLGGSSQIATGSWGCGAFYNNERVMFVIQALAARLAGVDLTHHVLGDGLRLGPAFELLEEALVKKMTVAEVIEQLVAKCNLDPKWQTKFTPEKAKRFVGGAMGTSKAAGQDIKAKL